MGNPVGQRYSFALRSISDREIGILRIYAEDEIAEETRDQCQQLFSTEFTNRMKKIKQMQAELDATRKKEEELKAELNKMKEDTC